LVLAQGVAADNVPTSVGVGESVCALTPVERLDNIPIINSKASKRYAIRYFILSSSFHLITKAEDDQ
jgi:hypothetical protein